MTRNTALIITGLTTLLCGCPGIFACFMGTMFAGVSFVPNADIDVMGSSDPQAALAVGIGALCLGALLVVIPIVVGFFTLRSSRTPNQPTL
jgi:hypothetical protein